MAEEEAIKNPLSLKLKKPFTFEGKEYKEVDLSGLEDLTCDDVVDIQKKYFKMVGKDVSALDTVMLEGNLEYARFIAAEVSHLPLEFFKRLPGSNAGALKTLVLNFFHGEI